MSGLKDFLNQRLPLAKPLRDFLREPQPENVSWAHTFGSALLFVLFLQVATGGFLMLFYAPTPDHAWESLNYMGENFGSGRLLRSLHVWGASLIILILTLHILRVVFHGAYKRPRELNWVSGMLSYLLVLGFAFTGYLLPWDQKGYWGTKVGTEMIARTPLLGPILVRLLRGGEEIGAYTLSRFFALHVFFLPALLAALVLLHLYLLRKHGIAPDPQSQNRSTRRFPFYPYQIFRDATAALAVLAILVLLAAAVPAGLDLKADPSDTTYEPRPEWYFLAHFELLRLFTGFELLPILILPNLIILLLLGLPFLDRSAHRYWKKRKLIVLSMAGFFAAMYGAVAYSRLYHPAGGVSVAEEQLPLPGNGDPALMARARQVLIEKKCINCHTIQGVGGRIGPNLSQAGWKFSRAHFRAQILDPKSHNPTTKMPSFRGVISEHDLEAVVEYLSEML
ncbi:MAG: cytochrome b N-terminal domain-containing protein [Acidobacteriota bacterium]